MKYGLWETLGDSAKNLKGAVLLKCKCECGLEKYILRSNLKNGHSKACKSCSQRKDKFLNKRFGKLTVIKCLKKSKSVCKCECGNIKIVYNSYLINGKNLNCGCSSGIVRKDYDEDRKQKMLSKIKISSNGCWEWQKSKNLKGYGCFSYKGQPMSAHRVAWLLFKGDIPKNQCILHKCDNPSCINPDHLWRGTQSENMQDMIKKGRRDFALTNFKTKNMK